MVSASVMAAAAVLAGLAWSYAARRAWRRGREPLTLTVLVAGSTWALATAAARLTDMSAALAARQAADFLMVLAAGALLTAVAVGCDLAMPVRRPGIGVSEATVLALAAATGGWVVVGAPVQLPPSAAFAMSPAVLDLVTLITLARLNARAPWSPAPRRRAAGRIRVLLLAAVACVLVADLLRGIHLAAAGTTARSSVGSSPVVPAVLGALLLIVFCLRPVRSGLRVLVERQAEPADDVLFLPRRRGRLLVYGMSAGAAAAVGLQALVTGTGPIPIFGLGCLALALAIWHTLLLLEQDDLLRRQVAARTRLGALVENTSDLLLRLDTNGRIVNANTAAPRLLHRTAASITRRPFEELARPQDQRRVREAVLEVTRGHRDSDEIELLLAPPASGTAQLRLRGVDGGAVASLNDVTDAVELRQRLERLARFDQMTGLANRTHLLDEVNSWPASTGIDRVDGQAGAGSGGIAVLYADLDGFKAVNDRFGHAAGDRVLIEVAARLDAVAGAVDARRVLACRVGGDEFILALEGVAADVATATAARLVEAIAPPFRVGGRTVQLGVSVGVAHNDDTGDEEPATTAAVLVHRADLAMYAAKQKGRSRAGRWRPELEERVRRRVDLAIGLRDALERGRLAVAYQPIVRLSDGHVQGVEALLRLPPGVERTVPGLDGLVSPAELVEVAEDIGAITELGEWVLRQAVTQAAAWARRGHDLSVSVNMSVAQLVSPAFVDLVTGLLDASGLAPSRLVLEITEGQLVGHSGPAPAALQALRAAGIRLAIDDFGTGYSSLSYLRRMPVAVVKIDRSLLAGLGEDPRAAALLSAVVAMARGLELAVVAEGMEDLATARALRDLGVQAGQGFALSRALPAAKIRELLEGGPIRIDETGEDPDPDGASCDNPDPCAEKASGPGRPGTPVVVLPGERSEHLNP